MPFNPFCETCRRAKAIYPQHRRVPVELRDKYEYFGQCVTGDAIRPTKEMNVGYGEDGPVTTGFLLRDLAFDFLHFAALPSKETANIELALNTFKGAQKIERFHSDAASELRLAAENLGIPSDGSIPYEHQGNGHRSLR